MYDLTLTPKIGLNLYLLAEAGRIVLITMQSVVVSQMKNQTCRLPSEQTLRLLA